MGLQPIERPPCISVEREPSHPTPSTSIPRSAAQLVFVEDETSWHLAIRIAELPRQWVEHAPKLVDSLRDWEICLPGVASVPAMQLWPGRGGIFIPVEPQQSAYHITAIGRWPDSWDVTRWLGTVPGLNADVTLFDTSSGKWLYPGATLEPEGTYFLVVLVTAEHDASRWVVQSLVSPEEIGRIGSWRAWAIELPVSSETRLQSWCEAIGYRLGRPRFTMVLVSPPSRFDEYGVPVVPRQETVVVGVLPVGSPSATEDNPIFYTASFQESGSFRLSLDDDTCNALQIIVEEPVTGESLDTPPELTVDLIWGDYRVSLRSLHDGAGPHELSTESPRHNIPDVQVRCLAPVSLLWEIDSTRGRRERELPDDVGTIIVELLRTAGRRQAAIMLHLDAGPYGRLSFSRIFASRASDAVTDIPPAVEQRARWLAAALGRPSRSENVVLITASAQRTLARLANLPGCAALRGVHAVPIAFISHVHAITRLVQN
jgi:hypothetical protein